MDIKTLVLGDYETNCFCVRADDSAKDCVIIDAGISPEPMLEYLEENSLNPVAVILTHTHIDHIFGLKDLRKSYPDMKIVAHEDDAEGLTDPMKNLSAMMGMSFTADPADQFVINGDTVNFAGVELTVIHTHGHTPGGMSLYAKDGGILFAGDTLFDSSIGRTDFPGGSTETLISSIRTKLLNLPDETIVYTGHGPETTIEREKQHNPFLK